MIDLMKMNLMMYRQMMEDEVNDIKTSDTLLNCNIASDIQLPGKIIAHKSAIVEIVSTIQVMPNEHLRHQFISKNNFNVVKIDMPLSPLDKQNDNEFVGDTGETKIIYIVNNSLYA